MEITLICIFILTLSNCLLVSYTQDHKFFTFVLPENKSMTLLPQSTQIHSTVYKSYLIINKELLNKKLIFECRAVLVETLDEAFRQLKNPQCNFTVPLNTTTSTQAPTTASTLNNTTPASTTPAGPTIFSSWYTDKSLIQLGKDQIYDAITVTRRLDVALPVTEIVVLTCCVRFPAINTNLSAATVVVADLQPDFCENCTEGIQTGDNENERVIQSPAFSEVAPCPCDLTYRVCDINCCCDVECSEDEKKVFSGCIPGLPGGLPAPVRRYNCLSNHPLKEDWFPLMCVMFEDRSYAFLGYFYANTPKLTNIDFNTKLQEQKNVYTFQETERRFADENSALVGYKDGSSIRTYNLDTKTRSILTLPRRTNTGVCSDEVPVRFLRDLTTDCVRSLTYELCQDKSPFSSVIYAESSATVNQYAYRILMQYGGSNFTLVNTDVSYYCTDDISPYIKSSSNRYSGIASPTSRQFFDPSLTTENCSYPCEEPKCLEFNKNRNQPPPLQKCSWDVGTGTVPKGPIFYPGVNLCSYPVLSLNYAFTWTHNSIVQLNAKIILANNVTILNTNPSIITQKIEVSFQHQIMKKNIANQNISNVDEPYSRSGYPGFDFGKPIISGCPDNATGDFQYVDTNVSRQMAIWKPDADGFCNSQKRHTTFMFGEDVQSACKLRLTLDDLKNCSTLKTQIFNHLSILMPSTFLGRYGYNDPKNMSHWINVMRDIPLDIFTVKNTTETLNISDLYNYVNTVDYIKGVCSNITSGIHLDIMYGEAGRTYNYSIREIIGARVGFTVTNWQFSCSTGSAACHNNSLEVQSFLLTSSVRFIKVPASTPVQQIKFYTSHPSTCYSDSCLRYFSLFDRSICHYDTCWQELLFPLTKVYTADSRLYTLGFSLLLIVFAIAYFFISRPWF